MTPKEPEQQQQQEENPIDSDKSESIIKTTVDCHEGESVNYWKNRHEKLEEDYRTLQKLNQTLEERLLNVVESFEDQKREIIEKVEYEKSTLMADMNKLSNKLVDARIKLHDYEEKEMIRQAECGNGFQQPSKVINQKVNGQNNFTDEYDPNLV